MSVCDEYLYLLLSFMHFISFFSSLCALGNNFSAFHIFSLQMTLCWGSNGGDGIVAVVVVLMVVMIVTVTAITSLVVVVVVSNSS